MDVPSRPGSIDVETIIDLHDAAHYRRLVLKFLTIVVKPFCAEAVLRAVAEADVISCVVREAKGYSRQKGYLDRYVGSEYSMAFLPKVEISVWVSDERAEQVADTIVKTARTGRM